MTANPAIFTGNLAVRQKAGIDIVDITEELNALVRESGIREGQLSACIIGSTGSLTTIEYEQGVVADLKRAIAEMAPADAVYEHEKAWHDGNGHSHVQAAILGPSQTFAVRNGRMLLGTWQQVVAINHDVRAKTRTIAVTVVGI